VRDYVVLRHSTRRWWYPNLLVLKGLLIEYMMMMIKDPVRDVAADAETALWP
jgi:hypothetical protein